MVSGESRQTIVVQATFTLSTPLLGIGEAFASGFLPQDVARFLLVITPILAGVVICVVILYDDASSPQSHVSVPTSSLAEIRVKEAPRNARRKVVVSLILLGFIAVMIIGAAALAVLDYYTFTATGQHLHLNIPLISSTGDTFLDLSTLMLVALIAGVLLIVGIMALAISLRPKPDELVGWTRPESLTNEQTGFMDNSFPQSNPLPAKRVVCRYCNRDIAHGRYCPECHLTSGYVVSSPQ